MSPFLEHFERSHCSALKLIELSMAAATTQFVIKAPSICFTAVEAVDTWKWLTIQVRAHFFFSARTMHIRRHYHNNVREYEGMRILLLALIALVSAPASASLIQIDIAVTQNDLAPRWSLPQGDVTVSLLLDTSSAVASFTSLTQPGRPTCISNYRFTNLSMTILDLSVGGESFISGVNSITTFAGDHSGACTSADSQSFYDGGGSFSGEGPRVGLSMDTAYGISIAELATAVDPIAMFFLSRTSGNGTLSVRVGDAGGSALFSDAQFSIREVTVPEPGTLGLLAASLLGIGSIRRRRPFRSAA